MEQVETSPLPVLAANLLVPAAMKVTGPDVNLDALHTYMQRVTRRARRAGIEILVFGSGGARQVPEGFDRERAAEQILDFARLSAELAASAGVVIVAEPLNRGECNILNSIGEAMGYVRSVNRPSFQCLLDTYHFWLENEPLANLRESIGSIRHVHVADTEGRVAPGVSRSADYQPVFRILKQSGYDARISVEANNFEPKDYAPVLEYLKREWQRA
jgi:sugar phosphate isomerase/epimerase